MDSSLYRFIFRHSAPQQIYILVVTVISMPFYYFSLDLPKMIVNSAINGKEFPQQVFGLALDQVAYLMVLSFLFLGLVCINGGFKYYINVYKGRLGERMLRRLRYELYARILRFPPAQFRKLSQGEMIPMITNEVEPVGGFIGDSVALPAQQGGILLTALVFMFMQDPLLGLAAIALYPVQGYIIPKLQRKVRQLGVERVRTVRKLADRIGETVSGIQDLHANDGTRHARAAFSQQLGVIYDIRYEIYRRKFFVKFLNNFLAQVTPFFFYAIGGYLVIRGQLSFGALVAVLAAYKDLTPPWKELLEFYQNQNDVQVKYEQVVEQFAPPGMLEEALLAPVEPAAAGALPLDGPLVAANLGLSDDDGQQVLEQISLRLERGEHIAVVGGAASGKEALALVLARLQAPSSGSLTLAGRAMSSLPEAVLARSLAYVGPQAHVFNLTLRDNLLIGLMQRPVGAAPQGAAAARGFSLVEARASGNSEDDVRAPWIDHQAAGAATPEALPAILREMLVTVDLKDEVYAIGLRGTTSPERRPELCRRLLQARAALRQRLAAPDHAGVVEFFAPDRYTLNATVAENLLFGTPIGDAFDMERPADHPYVRRVLDEAGLTADLLAMGRQVAATMVELFADLPPGHEFFAQFSFIDSDDLPEFQSLLGRVERLGLDGIEAADKSRLLALPFKLIAARHRLGLTDEAFQQRILAARHAFRAGLPPELAGRIAFFEDGAYNAAASIQDNILFGRLAYGQAKAAERVGAMIAEVVDALGLRDDIVEVGLDYPVGIGGARLTAAQRQSLAIARALLRRPALVILNEATSALDSGAQARVIDRVRQRLAGCGLLWVLQRPGMARGFDRVVVMAGGRVVEEGRFADLDRDGAPLRKLLAEE
ncbi:MAG: ABC transporter ATP-binding protein [Thalassobaculales bacterium]